MRYLRLLLRFSACALAACGKDSTSPPNPALKRGIVIIAGANATDTVVATLAQPLIVEIHDSTGAVAPLGAVVRFTAVGGINNPELYPVPLTSNDVRSTVSGNTDASGRTGAYIVLGYRAGTQRLVIDVPTLFLRDTVSFTAVPGTLARIDVTRSDSVLLVGKSATFKATPTDALGNARTDLVTWSIHGGSASVTSAGAVTTTGVGRAYAIAAAGKITDSASITSVPQGTLAAVNFSTGEIVTIDLDGSHRSVRAQYSNDGSGSPPRWIPHTDKIIYGRVEANGYQTLRVVDAAGVSAPFLVNPPATITHTSDAAPDPAGNWIYFAAWDGACGVQDYCLERARPDGTGVELLGYSYPVNTVTRYPSPSPDGAQVVFQSLLGGYSIFKAMDVASRTFSAWSLKGVQPQWSPVGGKIAFIDSTDALVLVKTNGTDARVLAPGSNHFWRVPFGWSPDGEWIVLNSDDGLSLVRVSTGEVTPLAHLRAYGFPSWR